MTAFSDVAMLDERREGTNHIADDRDDEWTTATRDETSGRRASGRWGEFLEASRAVPRTLSARGGGTADLITRFAERSLGA